MVDMKPQEFKSIRHSYGLSVEGMAHMVGVESGRTIRRWEDGSRPIAMSARIILGLAKEYKVVRAYLGIKEQ